MKNAIARREWLKQSSMALAAAGFIPSLFYGEKFIYPPRAASIPLLAQTGPEEAAVRACLENYMSGDGNRLEKAFHPSATMKYIDVQSGEFKDVPIAEFIARIKSNTTKTDRKIEIISMNIEGNAAQAKIRIETGQVIMNDYMNLLKVNGEWKIVSKIFSRQNK